MRVLNLCLYTPVLIILALSGCQSSNRVASVAHPETDFKSYNTFALLPIPEVIATPLIAFKPTTIKQINWNVKSQLEHKGYMAVNVSHADFLVVLHGHVQQNPYPAGAPGSTNGFDDIYLRKNLDASPEGTLIIDIIDPHDGTVAWRGWAFKNRYLGAQGTNKIQEVIQSILSDFPSR